MESMITSLVFDHALRIRLKAETEDTEVETPAIPPANIEPGLLASNGDTETARNSIATIEDHEPPPSGQAIDPPTETTVSLASTSTVAASATSPSVKDDGAGKAKKKNKKEDNLIGTFAPLQYDAPLTHHHT
jgi:hypothetical protein